MACWWPLNPPIMDDLWWFPIWTSNFEWGLPIRFPCTAPARALRNLFLRVQRCPRVGPHNDTPSHSCGCDGSKVISKTWIADDSWIRNNAVGVSLKGPAVGIFWGLTVYTLSPQKSYGSQRKNTRIQYPVSGRAILTSIFKTGIISPFLGMLTMFETTQQRLFGPIFHILIAVFLLKANLRMVQVFFRCFSGHF